jgi:hypothetical protein
MNKNEKDRLGECLNANVGLSLLSNFQSVKHFYDMMKIWIVEERINERLGINFQSSR